MLIGTKTDLEDERQVSYREGKQLAEELGINFLETSAKLSENVEEAFVGLAKQLKKKFDKDVLDPVVIHTSST